MKNTRIPNVVVYLRICRWRRGKERNNLGRNFGCEATGAGGLEHLAVATVGGKRG